MTYQPKKWPRSGTGVREKETNKKRGKRQTREQKILGGIVAGAERLRSGLPDANQHERQ